MTNQPVIERLAQRIALRLFTNGAKQHAKRLVLELQGGKDGGGWCEMAVRDQVAAELNAAGVGELVEALEPFAAEGRKIQNTPDDHPWGGGGDITVGEWRRTAAALARLNTAQGEED